jgi:hypothetical protein
MKHRKRQPEKWSKVIIKNILKILRRKQIRIQLLTLLQNIVLLNIFIEII